MSNGHGTICLWVSTLCLFSLLQNIHWRWTDFTSTYVNLIRHAWVLCHDPIYCKSRTSCSSLEIKSCTWSSEGFNCLYNQVFSNQTCNMCQVAILEHPACLRPSHIFCKRLGRCLVAKRKWRAQAQMICFDQNDSCWISSRAFQTQCLLKPNNEN